MCYIYAKSHKEVVAMCNEFAYACYVVSVQIEGCPAVPLLWVLVCDCAQVDGDFDDWVKRKLREKGIRLPNRWKVLIETPINPVKRGWDISILPEVVLE
jgi:hypothetical protein